MNSETQNNIALTCNAVVHGQHLNEIRKEAGLASFLSRIPHDKALLYWMPEKTCKQVTPESSLTTQREVRSKKASSAQRTGMNWIDSKTVDLANALISAGRSKNKVPSSVSSTEFGAVDLGCPDAATKIRNISREDPTETRGFARFIIRVDILNPGAIRRYYAGSPINSRPSPRTEPVKEDFWLMLEDAYERVLEETGSEVKASRSYLQSLAKAVPIVLAGRWKSALIRRKSKAR